MTHNKPILAYFSKFDREVYKKKSLKKLLRSIKIDYFNDIIVLLINYVKNRKKKSEK